MKTARCAATGAPEIVARHLLGILRRLALFAPLAAVAESVREDGNIHCANILDTAAVHISAVDSEVFGLDVDRRRTEPAGNSGHRDLCALGDPPLR